jgi:hypothetical protein
MQDSTPPDKKSPLSGGLSLFGAQGLSHAKELFPLDLKQIACRQTVATATNEGRS